MTPSLRPFDRQHLQEALRLARESPRLGSSPVGAVLVDAVGEVRARGRNRVNEAWDLGGRHLGDASFAHAEMDIYFQLGRIPDAQDCTLYTSLEPCLMCGGAAGMVGIGRILWACDDPWGGSGRLIAWNEHQAFRHTEVIACPFADLEQEGARLFAPEARRAYPEEGWQKWHERYPEIARWVDEADVPAPQEDEE
ncbi:nucleoside deaminase [Deinococcus peraridilitoris]|uniref:Cytosine/adenosine deaminase n=1 Tax=Deinococcus peraridilitoris (strain DSM 19664 / LMG 22246 / CIP 109416 / KR-200) TaxID=937777 RepID=L0A0S1_DEIPD|nr:nucleoside deaminase [Deinococcus peraridilitoris]AFZ66772.1 cytosine/adenosine deaminase [Deinococcus peraridilitoris DSM 19664]